MPESTQSDEDVREVEISDEAREEAGKKVAGLVERYDPEARPTVVLPGTNGMVSGTAFADMVDDDGNLKDDSAKDN